MYKFTCSSYIVTYYGEAERHFFITSSEHLGMTPLTRKWEKKPKKSAYFV